MNAFPVSPFLRKVLLADAGATAVTAIAMTFGASALSDILRLPAMLLLAAGLVLVPYAALVAYLATRERLRSTVLWTLIACNVLWALECTLLAFAGWVAPSALGSAFLVAQAVVVIAFAELQYVGLRRATASNAAWAS
jgi:hypothetical protein